MPFDLILRSMKRVFVPTVLAAGALAACGDRTIAPTGASPAGAVSSRASVQPPVSHGSHWTIDEMFAAVADSVPGFAGFWYDETGRIVVGLRNPETLAGQRHRLAELEWRLRPGRRNAPPRGKMLDFASARAVRSEYSFRQLKDVYSGSVFAALPHISGLTMSDIDERQNSIVIGVSRESQVNDARETLRGYDVPEAMVQVVVQERARPNALLSDPLRPVPGGARTKNSSLGGGCTAGFMLVKYMGTVYDTVATARYFISNSHCSSSYWATDYSQRFQGGSFAATETGDPAYFTAAPCPSGHVCRYTEANLMTFYDDSITADFPHVAYPASDGDTSFTAYKTVVAEEVPYTGLTVKMIGATSGRQSGTVTASCANQYGFNESGHSLLCQNEASYYGTGGDSGAPIVRLYIDGTVAAVGQHFGNVTVSDVWQKSLFSPMYGTLGDFYDRLPGYQFFSTFWY